MFEPVKVAAFSFVPRPLELEANADRMERCFRRAARRGVRLALAPEGALDGYPMTEVLEGRIPPEAMHDAAVRINHPLIRRFRGLARELRMCLAFGFAERVGKEIYNAALFLDHLGRLRGKYHKMQLAEGHEPNQWHNRMGSHSRAFDTPFGRCGFLICNDRWNADLARIPVLDGARYLLVPSYGSKSRAQDEAVVAIAQQNGVAVLEANVGVLLAVSKGQVVGRVRRQTATMVATLEIPAAPGAANRDVQEKRFLDWRAVEMPRRYRTRLKDPAFSQATEVPGFQIAKSGRRSRKSKDTHP